MTGVDGQNNGQAPWRCQCPEQCDEDEVPCWDDVTQEDLLCDHCRRFCAIGIGTHVNPMLDVEVSRG